jgi:uncharacterized membrane protein
MFILLTILTILGVGAFFIGNVFGVIAISGINTKLGIASILFPIIIAPICLFNYKKTQYASNFIISGLVLALVGGASLYMV